MSAFGIFFTQSRAFLAYQRMLEERKGKSNVSSLFGVERIPSDNQIRNLLDPQEPELLDGVFAKGLQALEPEFISPQDGHEKQDCKRAAIKRWVKRNAERLARHQCTLLGDDLYACQPMCELFLEAGFNYILVCKPESHVALRYFFNDLRASLRYMLFYNWNHLIRFMLLGLELIPDT